MLKEKEREEAKRITRKNKKIMKDGELAYYDKRTSDDKKLKTLYDLVIRAFKEKQLCKETKFEQIHKLENLKKEIENRNKNLDKTIQSKHLLYSLFQGLKEKNIEAYRKKDDAIKSQQIAKKEMTKNFEQKIDNVTVNYQEQLDIKQDYEKKKKELEKLAEDYKKLEAESKFTIERKEQKINNLQVYINDKIDKELKVLMDKFNSEKDKYDKLTGEREVINNQYKELKDKFQKYLAEIETSDAKIKTYTTEIESLQKKISSTVKDQGKAKDVQDETLLKMNEMDTNIASFLHKIETISKFKTELEKKLNEKLGVIHQS
jgi:chromosome segregation ATPase